MTTDKTRNASETTGVHGLSRRTVLKGATVGAGAMAFGLPALSGAAAAATTTESMTVVSDATTRVVSYRVGNDETCTFQPMDVPADPSWEHPSWEANLDFTFDANADWIWHCDEDNPAGNGEYYVREPIYGDIVKFERRFTVPGTPTSGTLHITADNGYEVWLNGTKLGSASLSPGWECSNLGNAYVDDTAGTWDTVEHYALNLQAGENVLTVYGVNEQQSTDDLEQEGTVTSNPGGVIFQADVDYEVETCEPCEFDPVKFEYDEEYDAFVPELEDGMEFDAITYESYVTKGDGTEEPEPYEPVSVTFATDVCPENIVATVKAGRATDEVDVVAGEEEGTIVVSIVGDERFYHPKNGKPFAISYVAFECVEPEE